MSKIITEKEIKEAAETLQKYKKGKANLENRIVEEEMFWKRRHWEVLRKDDEKTKPSSAWLFNTIVNKHADAMDNFPEVICLPREKDDEESAKVLTNVIPVVLERNEFEEVYSDNWWYKLKHGFCAYGVFWDNSAENGLGDIGVKKIDILNIFWEPGIRDIEKSRNLFICDLVPVDILKEKYPKAQINGGEQTQIKQYIHDDGIDTSDKALVVDWYYKKGGKLHYCKFCEDNVLYSSENEGIDSWYDDGEYPIVFDVLFPEEGTVFGFGFISITKDPQLYIDMLDNIAMDNAVMSGKPRYFSKISAGVNETEFLDWSKPIVHVEGDINEEKLRRIDVPSFPSSVFKMLEMKKEELKETSSNRDFNQGGTAGGVTSYSGIAILQEAGNKTGRDATRASYRKFARIINKVIERMRQFYTEERIFRIEELNKISDSDSVYEEIAARTGDNPGTIRELEKLRGIANNYNRFMQATEAERQANEQLLGWQREAEGMKELYPGFDLNAELQNPQFRALISTKNPQYQISMADAYKLIHHDELMKNAEKVAAEKFAKSVNARAARPDENGLGNQSGVTVKSDVSKLTKKDRADIARRAAKGERIEF